jgi:hypothetical protein
MKTVIEKYDYYECERCEINTETEGRMCPCPRDLNCDAEKKGEVIITKTIVLDSERNDIDRNGSIGQIIASMNV